VANSRLEEKFETAKSNAFEKHVDRKFHGTTYAGVSGITKSGFRSVIYNMFV
jgi:hypothetical protein